ncbi:ERF family protein, partial [Escherichia coli]
MSATFYERLASIQEHLNAPKNQYNSFGNYKYRSCEDILEGVKP